MADQVKKSAPVEGGVIVLLAGLCIGFGLGCLFGGVFL